MTDYNAAKIMPGTILYTKCQALDNTCPKPVAFIVTLKKGKTGYLSDFATCMGDLKTLIDFCERHSQHWTYVSHRVYDSGNEFVEEDWA